MWILFALLGAFFKAFVSFFRKKIAGNVRADIYMWINYTIMLLAMLPVVLYVNAPVLELIKTEILIIVGAGVTSIMALVFSIESLKKEELSYIAPLNAFIPIFTLILAWLFLKETPPPIGVAGIFMVFIGAYVINLKPNKITWYEPILHLLKNTGARFGIGVAVAFAANTVFIKAATNNGYSALTILFSMTIISWLLLLYVPIRKSQIISTAITAHKGILFGAAFSSLLGALFGILALAYTFSSYAISVRRLDVIFSILLGWHLLKETNIRNKLIGGALMTIGVAVISLA